IIIDGGSTDSSVEIIKRYAPWISFWQSENDNGQGHAINLGFSLADGDYYGWINSDDYYTKNAFFNVMSILRKNTFDFIYGYSLNYNVKTDATTLIKPLLISDYFIRIPTLAQPSCFWSSKIHQPIWEELSCSLDYELWLRMLKGQKRKRIKVPLSVANMHDNAKTYDPKMKIAWEKDHELICNNSAHGAVPHWSTVWTLHRIFLKLLKISHYLTLSFFFTQHTTWL
ncbi:MAG: glycosyltransferase, partial [Chryseobacterium sp.]